MDVGGRPLLTLVEGTERVVCADARAGGATMRSRRTLLATDLSHRCDRALDRAAALAAEWDAGLIALHVLVDPPSAGDLPSWRRPPDPRDAARRRILADLAGARVRELEVLVERGHPVDVVVEVTERLGCELVITGVARDETLGRAILGTTVDGVARRSRVPVLVVKSRPRRPYGHVVVATDFGDLSLRALATAADLFPTARLEVFHAYTSGFESGQDDRDRAEGREAAELRAREACRAFVEASPVSRSREVGIVCERGDVVHALHAYAEEREIDLVVAGSVVRGALGDLVLGSTARRLASQVPTDVLMVR